MKTRLVHLKAVQTGNGSYKAEVGAALEAKIVQIRARDETTSFGLATL
jgi:hypothetical protein